MIDVVEVNGQAVLNPEKVGWVERSPFLQQLAGSFPTPQPELEDSVLSIWTEMGRNRAAKLKVSSETVTLAQNYIKFRDQAARLPKFGRWVGGMFRDHPIYSKDLATAGKWAEASSDVVLSVDKLDILRCASTQHFYSCFRPNAGYEYSTEKDAELRMENWPIIPKLICEETAGISIAYVNDDKGFMRGRVWLHHAKRLDDGADCVVVCEKAGGTLPARQVAQIIKSKGIPAYYSGFSHMPGTVKVSFVDCFTRPVHHDLSTWLAVMKVTEA